jgi:hypothetical protein
MLFLLLSLHYLLLFHILDTHASNILTGSKDPSEIHYTFDLISRRQMWSVTRLLDHNEKKIDAVLLPPNFERACINHEGKGI